MVEQRAKCYSTKLQDAGVSTRLCRLFRRERLCEVQLRALPIPVPRGQPPARHVRQGLSTGIFQIRRQRLQKMLQ